MDEESHPMEGELQENAADKQAPPFLDNVEMSRRQMIRVGAAGLLAFGVGAANASRAAERKAPAKGASKEKKEWPVEAVDWQKNYYTQSEITSQGILVKAPQTVHKQAIKNAVNAVEMMLKEADPEIITRLSPEGSEEAGNVAQIAIVPKTDSITTLPEFRQWQGKISLSGEPYDRVRGLGAVKGQVVTAVCEANLLNLPGNRFYGQNVCYHEFAHAIMNLGFSPEQHEEWKRCHQNGRMAWDADRDLSRQMHDINEYWAMLSQFSFGKNDKYPPALVTQRDPAAFKFLKSVYQNKQPQQTAKKGRR